MSSETITCPDRPMLIRILEGKAPPEEGEALAQHVENCPQCSAQILRLREESTPVPLSVPPQLQRPWKAFWMFAATLLIVSIAIYCVVQQVHRP
ncbi:hypothetical protein KIH39_20820 [Telmatocola sphagniphila]|uniref:Zinc-finger domain-containing protein n=1 Tax=Telmatocola sphagniphila TaxID=1123043 RepID=A0A8E6B6F2_9BACT|nr:hypothetical protein [Telmatocola sphagniphila]QVL31265.1 hypothetical protein KIH39_20820 [Telmatocola sphagniphila]